MQAAPHQQEAQCHLVLIDPDTKMYENPEVVPAVLNRIGATQLHLHPCHADGLLSQTLQSIDLSLIEQFCDQEVRGYSPARMVQAIETYFSLIWFSSQKLQNQRCHFNDYYQNGAFRHNGILSPLDIEVSGMPSARKLFCTRQKMLLALEASGELKDWPLLRLDGDAPEACTMAETICQVRVSRCRYRVSQGCSTCSYRQFVTVSAGAKLSL